MVLHKSYTSLHPLAGSLTTASIGESPKRFETQPKLLPDKWGDHKALHWTLPGPPQAVQPVFRLRPTINLSCPEECNKEDWLDLLEKAWTDTKHYLPPDPSWAQLCQHAERICIIALDRLGIPRQAPPKLP